MKYMLLIYNNPATYAAWSEEERAALFGEVDVIMRELTESGELAGGEALADASQTKTIRVREGAPAITDGPFAEAKEQFAGYLLLECERPERAVEIAARWPDARYFAMEVRPVMNTSGTEM
ncbi:MAG: YciI family protein [Ktedonobacterales bacterium]